MRRKIQKASSSSNSSNSSNSEEPLQGYIDEVTLSLVEKCTGEMSVFLNKNSKRLPQKIWNLIKKKYDFKKNEIGLITKDWSEFLKGCVDEMQGVIDDENFFLDVLMIMFKERGTRPKGLREFIKQKMIKDNAFRKRMLMMQPKEFTEECNHIVSDLLLYLKELKTSDEEKAVEITLCEKSSEESFNNQLKEEKTESVTALQKENESELKSVLEQDLKEYMANISEEKIINLNDFHALNNITEQCQLHNQQYFTIQKQEIELLNKKISIVQSENKSLKDEIEQLNNNFKVQQSENELVKTKQNEEIELLNNKLKVQQSETELFKTKFKSQNEEIELLDNKLKVQQSETELFKTKLKTQSEEIRLLDNKFKLEK